MTVVHGVVDGEGRLISADPRLRDLQISAGGALGTRLAVPQLAALVRLARTLAIPVSRTVIAAEGLRTLELIVNARPENDAVRLAVAGWDDAPAFVPLDENEGRAFDFARLQADIAFETDADLRLVRLAPGVGSTFDAAIVARATGQPLTAIFSLLPDREGALPILRALARNEAFSGQSADVRGEATTRVILAGESWHRHDGSFGGLRGSATIATNAETPVPTPAVVDPLPDRLARALRTPLDEIVTRADAIASRSDGSLRQDYAHYASDIGAAARHLLGLVDDLRDVQAIEAADFAVASDPVDVADVARRAATLLAVRAADRRVKIDAPDGSETALAKGDFGRILQILVNLIGNAVRHSPHDSMIWIRIEEEDDLVAVVVADLGHGIAAADHDRIFDKFERLSEADQAGSGLGLYISRRLARLMGGDITVDSAPGKGARFALTLPRS